MATPSVLRAPLFFLTSAALLACSTAQPGPEAELHKSAALVHGAPNPTVTDPPRAIEHASPAPKASPPVIIVPEVHERGRMSEAQREERRKRKEADHAKRPPTTPKPRPGPGVCEPIRAELERLLPEVQACTRDAQCGQVMRGTSCGCSLDYVARLDADLSPFEEAKAQGCGFRRVTPCSCPATNGFICDAGRCSWDYT